MTARAGPLLLAAFALAALVAARPYPLWADGALGSGLMPTVGAGLVLLASLAHLLIGAGQAGNEAGEQQNSGKVVAYLAALVALPLATALLGMLPALALFVALVLVLIERLPLPHALLIAAGSMAFNWLVFQRLLQVTLPRSALW
jgi:Tripartite tricarboxylate transporter TctB family